MKTLAFDINVFNSKEQRVSLKALGMFYRPSIKAWVKRIYVKNNSDVDVKAQVTEFQTRIAKEFPSCPITVTPYTEADALKRAQYRADAGPAVKADFKKIKHAEIKAPTENDEIKQLLTLLLKKLG